MIEIRDATPDDAAQIAEINAAGWRTAYRGMVDDKRIDGISVKVWTREIQRNLEEIEPGSFSLAAELDGRFAGSCYVLGPARDGDLGTDVAELVAIYVDPALWGRGVGTALIEGACRRAASEGFTAMSLWTLTMNSRAQTFYERHGWRADGSEQMHPVARAPALRMRRSLP
jgi:GNAT superfamily N-acetyltransferase